MPIKVKGSTLILFREIYLTDSNFANPGWHFDLSLLSQMVMSKWVSFHISAKWMSSDEELRSTAELKTSPLHYL